MKLIKVIKDTGAHRVAEYRDTEVLDMGYGTHAYFVHVYKVQVRYCGFWITIKSFIETDNDDYEYCQREAIDLYNKIVYPDKYFVTNAVCE